MLRVSNVVSDLKEQKDGQTWTTGNLRVEIYAALEPYNIEHEQVEQKFPQNKFKKSHSKQ